MHQVTPKPQVRAGIYVRISKDATGEGLGVQRQQEDCEKLCADRGWHVTEVYADNDISASTGRRRPEYTRMLADIEAGRIGAVVVWAIDRLTRRPVELEHFIDLADRHNLALGNVTGDIDLSSPSGRFHARLMGNVARLEMEHKSARQKRAGMQAAMQGRPASGGRGGRCFGYTTDGRELIPAEAAALKQAYASLLAGASLGSIVRGLNTAGFTTTMGGPWTVITLRKTLSRARYAGVRTYLGEEMAPGGWPAIVDETVWRSTLALFADPQRLTHQGSARKHLLSGIARCGRCGGTMRCTVSESSAGTRRRVYVCSVRPGHLKRTADPVDALVEKTVIKYLASEDARALLIDDTADTAEPLRMEALSLRSRSDELALMLADGTLTRSQFTLASERVRSRLAEVEAQMVRTRRAPVLADLAGHPQAAERFAALDQDRKRAVISALVTVEVLPTGRGRVPFNPDTVKITPKP